MEDSSSLTPLPEEGTDQQPQSVSAFASIPARPPTQTPSQKYSALDWLGYFDQEDDISIPDSNDEKKGPLFFVCMEVVILASKIKEKARVVAMDLRGHGKSTSENDLDLSVETMCNDVVAVVKAMYGNSPPAIVLVGHRLFSLRVSSLYNRTVLTFLIILNFS
ncbi:Protein phosphatase methylesterase [Trema orientale]|uniref:Protein phosphatase methylesterase n=1 Tax=Trema orientale TaxID=63057 RepID=A0A2P5DH20_TREOI|nr:Protein phosphatase methylesterase [Trema orientale]